MTPTPHTTTTVDGPVQPGRAQGSAHVFMIYTCITQTYTYVHGMPLLQRRHVVDLLVVGTGASGVKGRGKFGVSVVVLTLPEFERVQSRWLCLGVEQGIDGGNGRALC